MKPINPMLATAVENLDVLKYPVLVSPKLDGIRCLIIDGVAMSRSLKPIPNKHVQEWVKYFEVGSKDSLRFPVYLGIRHEDDL